MQLNPVQQTAFALDPARQYVTPQAAPAVPAPSAQPANAPVQTAETPQDKANTGQGGKNGGEAQEQIADKLRAALSQLEQLREQARAALVAGDARSAKDAAQDAAAVANSIRNLTGSAPTTGAGMIVQEATQIQDQQTIGTPIGTSSGTGSSGGTNTGTTLGTSTGSTQSPLPETFALAFNGLDTANEVVDVAASFNTQSAEYLASVSGYKKTVMDALAGVAEAASKVSGSGSSGTTVSPVGGVDVSV